MNITNPTILDFSGHVNVLPVQILLCSIVFIAVFLRNASKSAKTKGRRLPPGPPAWPIVGNIPEMLTNRPTFRWIHRVMDEMQTEIACFRLASVHVIAVTSDEIAREAFRDKDAVFADRPKIYSAETLSDYKTAIFSPYGEQWRKMRRILTSELMSHARLNWLHDKRTEEADNLLAYVHNQYRRSRIVNVRDIALSYCHGVMMRLMFGRRYFMEATEDGGLGPMEKEHVEAIFKALDNVFSFCVSDYIPCLRGWNLDGQEKKSREACDVVSKYNELIINERIRLWREKGGKAAAEDWLDIFITMKDTDGTPLLTPQEISAECRDVCIATIDNPANNIEWTLAEMLNNPEILEKAINELDEIVGKDRLIQESDIPKLNYIKSCSRESFRLHPIAPFVPPHVALENSTLAGYFIPKGSHILVSRSGLGQNPKIWDNPHVFKPERHLRGNGCSAEVSLIEPDMRLVTFSTGRRGCVAGKLGTTMTVMLLARLLQGFTWSLPPGTDRIELIESKTNLLMAKPLIACVEPRLTPHMYPKVRIN